METREALIHTFSAPIVKRSAIVAIVVGTILNAINQGPELFSGEPVNLPKMVLTYLVPFCVASYGAWSALAADGGS